MTPQSDNGVQYPNYDTVASPLSFVSAEYEVDGTGRTTSVKHYWNQLNTSTQQYDREAIRGSSAAYAHPLGLKTSTSFLTRSTPGSDSWSTVRTEEYGYDQDFDCLTNVDYNDGLANEVQSWTYDAAGNRTYHSANTGTWTYDNLNRMSASPGTTYTHDAVGNRLTKADSGGSTVYGWDSVNRMTGLLVTPSGQYTTMHDYTYRADGMRVRKEVGSQTVRSYYDGQMPIEEDDSSAGTVTQNFIGARGVESTEVDDGTNVVASYPLYDTHGNMVATVTKNSSGTAWNIGNERSYDVWGGVRQGSVTGGPKGRYVANLGHVSDDESGLIYMRARYYEPGTGRFVSEDRACQGKNWYTYSLNNPIAFADPSGNAAAATVAGIYLVIVQFVWNLIKVGVPDIPNWAKAAGNTIVNGLSAALAYVAIVDSLNTLAGLTHPVHAMVGAPLAAIALVGVASIVTLAAVMNFAWMIYILAIDDVDMTTAFGVSPLWEDLM